MHGVSCYMFWGLYGDLGFIYIYRGYIIIGFTGVLGIRVSRVYRHFRVQRFSNAGGRLSEAKRHSMLERVAFIKQQLARKLDPIVVADSNPCAKK